MKNEVISNLSTTDLLIVANQFKEDQYTNIKLNSPIGNLLTSCFDDDPSKDYVIKLLAISIAVTITLSDRYKTLHNKIMDIKFDS